MGVNVTSLWLPLGVVMDVSQAIAELRAAGGDTTEHHLPPAHYIDSGIRFTAVLHQSAAYARPGLNATEQRIY